MNADDRPARSATLRAARLVSWVGHPLVFVSASLAIIIYFRLANRVGLFVLITLVLAVVLPMALLLIHGVRSGRWSDPDVSVSTERRQFYPRAILLLAVGVAALLLLHAPEFVIQGALVTLALLLIASVLNRYLKVSLHVMFAFYCAIILFRIGWLSGSIALCLALLVFWSRLLLRRHALADVLVGMFVGSIGAIFAAWWP